LLTPKGARTRNDEAYCRKVEPADSGNPEAVQRFEDKVSDLYVNSLLKILLRCWEIEPYRLSLLCAERCAILAHPSISSIPIRYSNSLEC